MATRVNDRDGTWQLPALMPAPSRPDRTGVEGNQPAMRRDQCAAFMGRTRGTICASPCWLSRRLNPSSTRRRAFAQRTRGRRLGIKPRVLDLVAQPVVHQQQRSKQSGLFGTVTDVQDDTPGLFGRQVGKVVQHLLNLGATQPRARRLIGRTIACDCPSGLHWHRKRRCRADCRNMGMAGKSAARLPVRDGGMGQPDNRAELSERPTLVQSRGLHPVIDVHAAMVTNPRLPPGWIQWSSKRPAAIRPR